jgi:3-oxoacyl-[acyl-carrier-protein] synthase II
VSICGIGAVSGYGWGEKLLREGLYTSESAVRCRSGFSPTFDDDWGWVALVDDAGNPDDGPSRMMRAVRHSGREAVHNAFDRGWRPGGNVGLIHGVVLGDVDHWADYHHRHGAGTTRRNWLELMPSTVLTGFMKEFDFHGPSMNVTAMCASGVVALLTARMWINAGLATDVVVIASDLSVSPENARSFGNLGVLHIDAPPWDVCRPFQEGSRGFNPGEASVAMVVSGRPQASYGTVLGGAMSSDGYHPVSIAPDYSQVRRAFTGALEDAGVLGSDIAYLNAHGTGTAQCDGVEGALFDELLPGAEGLFSMKPLVGHTQGASAAIEILASLYGFETGVIPAPRRVSKGHPKLLDGLTACAEGPIMKSSLGMGGHNAVVVLEAPKAAAS